MKRFFLFTLLIQFHLLLVGSFLNVYSQSERLQFKHFTPDDGLSSSSVTCFLQDYKGFMWIGTYYGLNRYDGLDFILSLIHISEPTRLGMISYAVFCLKKKERASTCFNPKAKHFSIFFMILKTAMNYPISISLTLLKILKGTFGLEHSGMVFIVLMIIRGNGIL